MTREVTRKVIGYSVPEFDLAMRLKGRERGGLSRGGTADGSTADVALPWALLGD